MGAAGVVVGPDNKPIPVQQPAQDGEQQPPAANAQAEQVDDEEDDDEEDMPPAKKTLSVEQVATLARWREICNRRMKRADPVTFTFHSEDKLPADVVSRIKAALATAQSFDDIKAAFEIDAEPVAVKASNELLMLAQSINNMVDRASKQMIQEIN